MPERSPSALDSLKRAFRNIFKRGKKSKQDSPQPAAQRSQPAAISTASPGPPPQLPPLASSSPLQSAGESPRPLPPTHPLATGTHKDRQEAVPQNYDARPGPPPGSMAPATPGSARVVNQEEPPPRPVSPPEQSPAPHDSRGEQSLDVQRNDPPVPSPISNMTDDARASSATENSDHLVSPEKQDSPMVTSTSAPDASKENKPPPLNRVSSSEEKVAVLMDDPPPIKAVRAAPGMSATSGPLEDFPEGGEF